ncbi:hypothetical protein [Magnetospira thiophila]
MFDSKDLTRIFKDPPKPSPREQADTMVLILGYVANAPAEEIEVTFERLGSEIGSPTPDAFEFVIEYLLEAKLAKGEGYIGGGYSLTLTFTGWDRFEALKKGVASGRELAGIVQTVFGVG